ncbi:hypothetical protein D4R86_04555 [bacterium]|nr:MAG: hypothetical protein D4R86_04555 [bacterium]
MLSFYYHTFSYFNNISISFNLQTGDISIKIFKEFFKLLQYSNFNYIIKKVNQKEGYMFFFESDLSPL